jgi:hypothetical protein
VNDEIGCINWIIGICCKRRRMNSAPREENMLENMLLAMLVDPIIL